MSTGGARAARQQFSRAGEVKVSAADVLRAALNPPPEEEPEAPVSWLDVARAAREGAEYAEARKAAEAQAEAEAAEVAKSPAQRLMEAVRRL